MKKFLCVLLHILGYPVMIAAVVLLNMNVIKTQVGNYSFYVFIGLIVAVVMTIIYYICYAAITSKKKSRKNTIFKQTVKLCMVVVFTMTGLWAVCDLALPDMLATATSSTVYYEDLADGWQERAQVNAQLLDKFIDLSVKEGTLPTPEGMNQDEAIKYYQKKGLNKTLNELSEVSEYGTIGGLLTIQYQSINANGYQTFTHPWIDCATSDRLTIPCLIHLLLDEREIDQDSITNYDYTEYDPDTKEVTTVMFAVCDKATNTIVLKNVNWTVLDMLGTDTDLSLDMLKDILVPIFGLTGPIDVGPFVSDTINTLVEILKSEGILNGAELNVIINTGYLASDLGNIDITLRPTTGYYDGQTYEKTTFMNGILGYQEMAWLDSNGLIYALVTLFSLRKVFLIFAAWGVVINVLIGLARGMGAEEREQKIRTSSIQASLPERNSRAIAYGAPNSADVDYTKDSANFF